jgi:haloalkane dehalogenase
MAVGLYPPTLAKREQEESTMIVSLKSGKLWVQSQGKGPPLLMIHGWPFHGQSFRKINRILSKHFTCIIPDLPGAGKTSWTEHTPFGIDHDVQILEELCEKWEIENLSILAYDSGGIIARLLAHRLGTRVQGVVLGNTEIPGYIPPALIWYQRSARFPALVPMMQQLLRIPGFATSRIGFGIAFADKSAMDDEFCELFIEPLIQSRHAMEGYLRAMQAFDVRVWKQLPLAHKEMTSPVLLLWGKEDTFFPLEHAKNMVCQF